MSSEGPRSATRSCLPSGKRPNPAHEPLASRRRPADQEDGVIAGERAEDVGPGLGVDRARDWLGTTGNGTDDDHFAHPIDGTEERREHGLEHRISVGPGGTASRQRIARTLRGRDTRDAELAQIARERRLSDVPPALSEHLAQLFLTSDLTRVDDLADGGLAHALVCHGR